MVIIDYLQLMRPEVVSRANRNEELDGILADLKGLAMDIECPILLGVQLNREAERRAGHRPIMSDAADCGKIEAHADLVIAPFRPGYYSDVKPNNYAVQEVDLLILKHRNGQVGTVKVGFMPALGRWSDIASSQPGDADAPGYDSKAGKPTTLVVG
jgi:replicative DNA helicase